MGGTNVAIAWPNIWLSGSRFRNLSGRNGSVYFLYFAISRSIGTMLARMFLCVRTTPFGSAVAPDVKIISAVVSLPMSERGPDAGGGRAVSGKPAGPLRKISGSFQIGL